MRKVICNKCGKQIGRMEAESSLHYHGMLGYASSYDGLEIEIDLCPNCLEWLMDELKIDPAITDVDWCGGDQPVE